MSALLVHHGQAARGEKRNSGDAAETRTVPKRPRLDLAAIQSLSKAEQTILQGAAEILDLNIEQLMTAADRYRAQSAPSAVDSGAASETTSEFSCRSSLSHPGNTAGETASNDAQEPFQLLTTGLPLGRQDHQPPRSTVPRSEPTPVTRPTHLAAQGEVVTPWLDDMFQDNHQVDWGNLLSQLGHSQLPTQSNQFLYPSELDISSRKGSCATPVSLPVTEAMPSPAYQPAGTPELGSVTSNLKTRKDGRKATTHGSPSSLSPKTSVSDPIGLGQRRTRGPFKDLGQRIETSLTRKKGACIRCRMQKIRCVLDSTNSGGCCLTCAQVARTRTYWVPCLRYKIKDANLLDHGKCPRPTWTLRWDSMAVKDITNWASEDIKTITCTQDVLGTTFKLRVRRFVPVAGDALSRKWKNNGAEKSFECPPYGMANMQEAAGVLAKFVDRTMGDAISFYIDESDKLMRDTYMMAYRQSKMAAREDERRLLVSVLRLWAASRLACRSDRIYGEETLGMKPQYYDSDDPNSGIILTPPVFSAQMEVIVTSTLLIPSKIDVLARLKKLIHGSERRSWFVIYLAMFVLLHNCALLTKGDNKKARKQGFEARFFRPSLVESLHNGARVLLAYFHYSNRGSYPFKMDWGSPAQQASCMELDGEQIAFMQQTVDEIEKKGEKFQQIRQAGDFEHDYYFISQLYDVKWEPIHTI